MMWFSLGDQTVYFLWSIVFGVVLGVLYGVFRSLAFFSRAGFFLTVAADIFFFALCGLLTSLFALPFNRGDVRFFIIAGEGIGFLVYYLTLYPLTYRAKTRFFAYLYATFKKISDLFKKFFDLLLKLMHFVWYNIHGIIAKTLHLVSERKSKQKPTGKTGPKKELKNERKKRKNRGKEKKKRLRGK